MYLIKFIRKDLNPDEDYYYHNLTDAQNHFDLFHDDDSDLYQRIELLQIEGLTENLLNHIDF